MIHLKKVLRHIFRHIRRYETVENGEKVVQNLLAFLGEGKGRTLALYVACDGEVAVNTLYEPLTANGWRIVLPVVLPVVMEKEAPMIFRPWHGEPLNEKDAMNMPIPSTIGTMASDTTPDTMKIDTMAPDIIVLPLVAFDDTGARLGMGAGCYDRTLPLYPNVLKVGAAFNKQKFNNLPTQKHDAFLDVVITETEVKKFK